MKISNTTDIPTTTIRELVRFCLPENVDMKIPSLRVTNASRTKWKFTVEDGDTVPQGAKLECVGTNNNGVKAGFSLYTNETGARVAGRYYRCPIHVIARVSKDGYPTVIKPYQYAQHKGVEIQIADRIEALVYVLAHELRHHWQFWGKYQRVFRFPKGYAKNSRGIASEVDTEAYAIHTLNRWRAQGKAGL